MRIIDAHSHLNLKSEAPLNDFLAEMDSCNVERSLLILNIAEEREAFIKEYETYLSNNDRFALSCGLDINNSESKNDLDKILDKTGKQVVIKIHPKLFRIEYRDIQKVVESVSEYNNLPIMVDSLYYGEDIEHHIGVELSVALAREYRDRNIIVAHSGSVDFLKCMMACRYMPHVSFDYSFIQSFFSKTSLRLDMVNFLKRTSNRIMFGSDRPSFNMKQTINDMLSIAKEADLTDIQLDDVMYGNALKMYWES